LSNYKITNWCEFSGVWFKNNGAVSSKSEVEAGKLRIRQTETEEIGAEKNSRN
jgi:hypothetical protein